MRRLLILAVSLCAGCMTPAYSPSPVTPTATPSAVPPAGSAEVVISGGDGREVLAEGMAALPARGGADIARDQALNDALRKAVEQGVGTLINSETQVENFALLSDRIYSQSTGYVSSYRVITEGLEGALYRVVVRAKVKTADIEDDLAAIGILLLQQGRPRVMVVVKELAGWDDFFADDRVMSQTMIETMLLDRFQAKGFPVVDAATVKQNLKKEQLKKILEGDNEAAVLLGLETGAEVVVGGTVERSVENRTIGGTMREVHVIRMSTRAVGVEDARILGASAITTKLPFSVDQAREQVVDSTARELTAEILGKWKKRENFTILAISNSSFERVQLLKSEIGGKLRGVIRVISRDLMGSTGTLEVISETSSQEILDQLGTRNLAVGFEVTGFAGNRIELRLTEEDGQ